MMRRRSRVAALVLLPSLLLFGGCGSDDGPGLDEVSSPTSAAATDTDGFTAEEREVVDAVDAYAAAIFARGGESISDSLKGKVTDDLYAMVVPDEKSLTEDKGKQRIGDVSFQPTKVTVSGDEAEARGCMNATNAFVVDQGQTEAGAGAIGGTRTPMTIELERVDGAWLVASPVAKEGSC